jgi:general L-amino acid transport system permease protein
MSYIDQTTEEPVVRTVSPPSSQIGPVAWARKNLFSSIPNTLLTLLALFLLVKLVPPLLDWLLFSAVFTSSGPEACKDAAGACWSLVAVKHRFMLFGFYTYEEQWRPAIATIVLLALICGSGYPRFWGKPLAVAWLVGLPLFCVLMWGGVFGLPQVETDRWGGLPLTVVLAAVGIVVSFPLGVVLALGRRSTLPAIRTVSTLYIELIRGVPLISVLFMASVMFPLFLPEGVTVNKLLRAQVGIILFTAAYQAETVRGGLQALPKGQYEAADALGLSYWQKTLLIVLPQSLKLVIPSLVNQFISTFKDTSLVLIIGLYDFLTTSRTAVADPAWQPFYVEAYAFAAIVYFAFCFSMSRYSQFLERRLGAQGRR